MSNPLKKISIAHLRGSTQPFALNFDVNKKLTLIYGENATGKSTICDAFEFLGKSWVGSLDGRGIGKTESYWASVGKTVKDIQVTLEDTEKTCTARMTGKNVTISPIECKPKVEILRRNQVTELLLTSPADRYKSIQRFIDVSDIETAEASLQSLFKYLQASQNEAANRLNENNDEIQRFWETAGKPAGNPLEWAEAEARRNPTANQPEIETLRKLQRAFDRLNSYPEKLKQAQSSLKNERDQAQKAEADLEAKTTAASTGELLDLLQAAAKYLHQHKTLPECPVCGSAEKAHALAEQVDQKLATLASVKTAQTNKKQKDEQVKKAEQKIQLFMEEFERDKKEFESFTQKKEPFLEKLLPTGQVPGEIGELAGWLKQNENLSAKWKKAENERTEETKFREALKKAIATLKANYEAQITANNLLPRVKQTLEIIAEERRSFTDAILQKIAAKVGSLYESIHPGEGLDKISLQLDPKKRASLEIAADFLEKENTPPQAYFSDSHLDTLALCLFLALAALDEPENIILILDDVLASVDEPHVDRVIEMVYTEVAKFRHCIITTHYRPWKQKFRWGWLKGGECQFVELAQWTSEAGLMTARSTPDIERLRQLLTETPPDPQLICSKAGYILEAALNFLTQLYECPLPRKNEDRYTLGDLLKAFDRKLKMALKIEIMDPGSLTVVQDTISLTPIFEELLDIAQARNFFGAHFNPNSFALPEGDAIRFGKGVLNLMEALIDDDCGWPRNDKSGSYWTNGARTRRLHPLRKPG